MFLRCALLGRYCLPVLSDQFVMENCSYAPKFHTILTLVFNFVHYNKEDVVRASDVMSSANKLYPNMRIIAAIPDHLKLDSNSFQHTSLYSYSNK